MFALSATPGSAYEDMLTLYATKGPVGREDYNTNQARASKIRTLSQRKVYRTSKRVSFEVPILDPNLEILDILLFPESSKTIKGGSKGFLAARARSLHTTWRECTRQLRELVKYVIYVS